MSDSTFSGKPLTDLSLVDVRKMMDSDNGIPKQSSLFVAGRKAGFQAGLKKAAERTMNCYEPVGSDDYQRGFGEAKRAIQQAILKEISDDSSE